MNVACYSKLLLGGEDDMSLIWPCLRLSLPVAGITCISLAQQQHLSRPMHDLLWPKPCDSTSFVIGIPCEVWEQLYM